MHAAFAESTHLPLIYRIHSMFRTLALLALLCGCTSIDYDHGPIQGLEHMTVEEHRVDPDEIYARCARCGQLGFELPSACTCVNFRTRHALIWLPLDASQAMIEHERAHSRGYDDSDGHLRSRYAAWVRAQQAAPAGEVPPLRAHVDWTQLGAAR